MSEAGSPAAPPWRRVLARRRTRVVLALVLVLVAVRMALPGVLRRVVVSQADEAMVGRIEIDDIDLALLAGELSVHGLRVYGEEAASDRGMARSKETEDDAGSTPAAASPDPARPTDAEAWSSPARAASAAPATAVSLAATSPAATDVASPSRNDRASPVRRGDASPAPEAGAGPPGSAPVVSAQHVTIALGFRALLHRLVDVRRVTLDGVAVSLDRAKDGKLMLPAAAPATEPTPPPPAEGSGWGVLIQSMALHDGRIGFRDFAVGDPPQRVEVTLPAIEAAQLALLITQRGLQPGKVFVDAGIRDGTLHLEAALESLPNGPAYESHLVLHDVPIADSRVYIPQVGWSGLTGRLDTDLIHRFESQGAHTVRGTAALRDLDVRVAGLDDPALAWRSLAVDVAGIDFVAQHADVTAVTLDGARIVTRPAGPDPLPVLLGLMTAAAEKAGTPPAAAETAASPTTAASPAASPTPDSTTTEPPPATSRGAPPSTAAAAPPSATVTSAGAKPWTWTIGTARVVGGHVQAIGGDGPVGVDVDADAAPVTSVAGKAAVVRVALAPSSGGMLELRGNLVPTPLAFDGKLTTKDLQLAALTQPVATSATRLLKGGVANLDLEIVAGATANAPPDGVHVSGTIDLSDLDVTGDDPGAFAVRWKSLAVAVSAATAPGVLGLTRATAAGPFDVALGAVTLTQPDVTITRTANGIALPAPFGDAPPPPQTAPSPAAQRATPPAGAARADHSESPSPGVSPAAAAAASAAPPAAPGTGEVRVRADRVTIAKMKLTTHDTTVQPFFHSTLDPVDLTAVAVGWPGPSAKDVKLVAKSADGGVLTVTGDVAPARTRLVAKLTRLPLAPFNPYAARTGYGVSGGTAELQSTIVVTSGAYETKSHLVLHELGVTSGEGDALFMSKFGMPLELALSLLTDLQGNIVLELPIAGDAAGMRTDVGTVLANALTRAILNAVTSPLKLIGAVAHVGEKPATVLPRPLVFRAGRAALAEGEAAKLAPLGSLLARAPGLRLHLRGEAGDTDRRWLREQALHAKLEEESGVLGSVRHIGERGARKAARAALAARAAGQPGDIPAEYREWFEAAVAAQTVDDAALRTLADARTAAVRAKLASSQGVDGARIVIDEPRVTDPTASPVVAVGLGAPAPQAAAPK